MMLKQSPSYDTVEEHKLLQKVLKPNFGGTIYVDQVTRCQYVCVLKGKVF